MFDILGVFVDWLIVVEMMVFGVVWFVGSKVGIWLGIDEFVV